MENLSNLKTEFLEQWSISRLENMSLEEYTNHDNTSFCYWVDKKTDQLGTIKGGSPYKFGIYKQSEKSSTITQDNRIADKEFAWFKKYGNTKEKAFETVKGLIIKIVKAVSNNQLSEIDSIDLGESYKWKIAFLYSDYTVLNLFKENILKKVSETLSIKTSQYPSLSELHQSILKLKPTTEDFYVFSNRLLNSDNKTLNQKPTNIMTTNNSKLQEQYNNYEKNKFSQQWAWYKDIKKYSKAMQFIIDSVNNDVYSSYEELNKGFKDITNPDEDFLQRYLFQSENGFSRIRNQLITLNQRLLIRKKVKENPNQLFDLLKEDNPHQVEIKCHQLIGENKWTVIHRFIRAMFPDDCTSIDYTRYFNQLERVLKDQFQIKLESDTFITKNREVCKLITSDDNYIKQIFFWDLLYDSNTNNEERYNIEADFIEKESPKNQILYGPSGTGKTYQTKELAIQIINPDFLNDTKTAMIEDREAINKEYDRLCKKGQIVFTTFHQSMSYEDFVEGIKPETSNGKISYEIVSGIFKDLCDNVNTNFNEVITNFKKDIANGGKITIDTGSINFDVHYTDGDTFIIDFDKSGDLNPMQIVSVHNLIKFYKDEPEEGVFNSAYVHGILNHLEKKYPLIPYNDVINNTEKNYVLIIDEINRGNVSQIFGELITLLEEDKRLGASESIQVKLPYSKNLFGVPKNLYIIGTMNTADRSVEALDSALRRRFSFTELMPRPELLKDKVISGIKLSDILDTINKRIEVLIGREHTIGHSYFIKISTLEDLTNVFRNKIVPLLQEYFYNDYGKIGLVLGKGFVRKLKEQDVIFADFNLGHQQENYYEPTYELINVTESMIEDALLQIPNIKQVKVVEEEIVQFT